MMYFVKKKLTFKKISPKPPYFGVIGIKITQESIKNLGIPLDFI